MSYNATTDRTESTTGFRIRRADIERGMRLHIEGAGDRPHIGVWLTVDRVHKDGDVVVVTSVESSVMYRITADTDWSVTEAPGLWA